MKQGVLSYQELSKDKLFNIGDYIQSIAAMQYLDNNKPISYIDREYLNQFKEEKTKLILNGWFMHNVKNWPPSDNIKPLFISFHINNSAASGMLSKVGVDYLKKFQPIGCRDYNTEKILKDKGIDAYFSGCLTLTLGHTFCNKVINKIGTQEEILIVDPLVSTYVSGKPSIKELISLVMVLFVNPVIIFKLFKKQKQSEDIILDGFKESIKVLLSTIRFYRTFRSCLSKEVMLKATHITHMLLSKKYPTNQMRFDKAQQLLERFSTAKYVITSRIHCALPCLAMGTPVAYIVNHDENDISHCRFGGISDLFRTINVSIKRGKIIKSYFSSKLDINTCFENDNKHVELAAEMTRTCKKSMIDDE